MSEMLILPSNIKEFIKEHHVLTLASSDGNDLWCANAFYAYDEEENTLIITSQESTRHIKIAMSRKADEGFPIVAGSIVLETESVGKIRGLQFTAWLVKIDDYFSDYRMKYLKRFPYAILKGGELWLLRMKELKFTDNRLGFGKKINLELPFQN